MFFIKGSYNRKIFYNEESGFLVGMMRLKETNCEEFTDNINKLIIFTGYFATIHEDEIYIMYGNVTNHSKYGLQFSVDNYERIKPETKEKLIEYLSSDLFSGIGKKQSKKIVDILGEDAIDKIMEDATVLTTLVKMSKAKADLLYSKLVEAEESHKVMIYLTELGFSTKEALKIYNQYSSDTINYIEHNIYDLIDNIQDMNFIKIDRIAKNFKFEEDNDFRIMAAIIYIMKTLAFTTGDSYFNYEEIQLALIKTLGFNLSDEKLQNYLQQLELELKIIISDNKYYLYEYYEAETEIVEFLKILKNKIPYNYKESNKYIKELEKENNIKYNIEQKEAIKKSLNDSVAIITGGPGTGKTTIIKAIVEIYKKINNLNDGNLIDNIALLAPTGRASKRLAEATNVSAMTIHRFLKWNKETDQFLVNEYNKNNSKLVIIDEASMIDILLFHNLIKGITTKIRLIIIGDYHQLPSVAPGQVLKDLIKSEKIETINLSVLYRQDNNSYIPYLAKMIKNGQINDDIYEKYSDYQFLECSTNKIADSLVMLVEKIISAGYDYKKNQIMVPIYRGINGIDNLNVELQKVFNKKDELKKEFKYGNITFRENDKVINLVNMPEENIYNGDIGIIKDIIFEDKSDSKKKEIHVDFDGNIVKYLSSDFNSLRHAYVISIHKSQGSEFDTVIVPMCNSYGKMLYRRLIYTGVTRTKRKLFIIGSKNAFENAINNNSEYERKSDLMNKLVNNL